jgi:hypothetical protein
MVHHRESYNRFIIGKGNKITVYEIFEEFGIDNCKIELVELFPCDSKEELLSHEGYYIRNNRSCVK